MNEFLRRDNFDAWVTERHMLIRGLVIVVLVSVVWHLSRPQLVRFMARLSVGCVERTTLLVEGLRASGFDVPPDESLLDPDQPDELETSVHVQGPWIALSDYRQSRPLADSPFAAHRTSFFDADLRLCGSIDLDGEWLDVPTDHDGDTYWEVLVNFFPLDAATTPGLRGVGVLRLREDACEICGIIVWDEVAQQYGPRVPSWGAGVINGPWEVDLPCTSIVPSPNQDGSHGVISTSAWFAWDRPGGVLKVVELPPQGGVYFSTPTSPGEWRVPRGKNVTPILGEHQPARPAGPP